MWHSPMHPHRHREINANMQANHTHNHTERPFLNTAANSDLVTIYHIAHILVITHISLAKYANASHWKICYYLRKTF